MSRKRLKTDDIQSDLQRSAYFSPRKDQDASSPVVPKPKPVIKEKRRATKKAVDVMPSQRHEAATDIMTSSPHDVNKKLWCEVIEETETHNSSLRISIKEREQIEDVIRDLKRKYKIKTSMNEMARLGLLFLLYDFKRQGEKALIIEVKKA